VGKRLFKATVFVSGMTLLSRLLGFVRDMLIARLFGVDVTTDAFFVAFKIPNLLRRLFTEGAFAHAIVPIMAKRQSDKVALREFIGKAAGTLAAWAAMVTVLSMVMAPLLVLVLAPGFAWLGAQYDLAVSLLRITLPFGLCIVLVAFAGAMLNAREHYAIPALTPIILNISMIAAALWLAPLLDVPITALAWGVLVAGVLQLLFQIPNLVQLGLLPRLTVKFRDPDVSLVIHRLLPAIFSASVTQVNLLLDALVASFLVSGSVSWLYYSERLVDFPLGILGIGLATVILPNLAKHHALDDTKAFSSTLDWGLRLALLVGMPATIGLFVLAEPMLSTLFQYDEFTRNDVRQAGQSLKAYSVGLLGYLVIKILVSGFTSRHDLKTPVRYGMIAMITSLALNVLAVPLAHAGLALATSLGALLNAALLLGRLLRDKVYQPGLGWLLFLVRVTLASAAMTVCLCYFVEESCWQQWSPGDRVGNLLKWISIGFAVYALTLAIFGLRLRHLAGTSDKIHSF
jgi:putative peptidoglycan lipid II flippase